MATNAGLDGLQTIAFPTSTQRRLLPCHRHSGQIQRSGWRLVDKRPRADGQTGSPHCCGQPHLLYPGFHPGLETRRQPGFQNPAVQVCHFTHWVPPQYQFRTVPAFDTPLDHIGSALGFKLYSPNLPHLCLDGATHLERPSVNPTLVTNYCAISRRHSPDRAIATLTHWSAMPVYLVSVPRDSKAGYLPGSILHQVTDYAPSKHSGLISLQTASLMDAVRRLSYHQPSVSRGAATNIIGKVQMYANAYSLMPTFLLHGSCCFQSC
jgi:hypothetical protein